MPTSLPRGSALPVKPMAPVEVEYVLEYADLVARALFADDRRRSPVLRAFTFWLWRFLLASVAVVALAVAVCYAVLPLFPELAEDQQQRLAIACFADVIVSAILIAGFFLNRDALWNLAREAALRQARRTAAERFEAARAKGSRRDRFLVHAEGFTETTEWEQRDNGVSVHERKETRVPWEAVECIAVREGHAFFVVPGKGVWVVPERACPGEAAWERFVEAAEGFRQACLEEDSAEPAREPGDEHPYARSPL